MRRRTPTNSGAEQQPPQDEALQAQLRVLPVYRPTRDTVSAAMRRVREPRPLRLPLLKPALAGAALLLVLLGVWFLRPGTDRPLAPARSTPSARAIPGDNVEAQVASLQYRLQTLRPRPHRIGWPTWEPSGVETRISRLRNRLQRTKAECANLPPIVEKGTHKQQRRHA
jgi:hypothetical protein